MKRGEKKVLKKLKKEKGEKKRKEKKRKKETEKGNEIHGNEKNLQVFEMTNHSGK